MENDLTGSNWAEKIFGKRESHSPDDPCPDGMGNCSEVKDNASDFIDGEVSPTIATRLKHHLGICDNCDGWMASLAQTVGLLRQSPQHEVPESLRRKSDHKRLRFICKLKRHLSGAVFLLLGIRGSS